jgi:hypothetical protein
MSHREWDMSVFVILRVAVPEKLRAAIVEVYPDDHIELAPNEWMVADKGTAIDVSNKLKITDATSGLAMVVGVEGYYGRAPTPIWDWLKAKLEASYG